jgi:hypothetical protein
MELPLITVDSQGELTIFSTPDMVSRYLEAQDVRDGEFRLFDCAGVEYLLSADTDSSPIIVGPAIGDHTSLVRAVARRYLESLPARKRRGPVDLELRTPGDVSRALSPYAM